ncbi:conjugal transfer protein [Streptomyces boninensis]|uniref:conjugal transfer protein n=1 Tax=Streptomyces boninensis TaxID=2039455 RepID=UPI003B21D4FC
MNTRRTLTTAQKAVLTAAFLPMVATGIAGGIGTFSNVSRAYGQGTALGAVAAGEGATAVLALVLLGLTMLGQAAPRIIRVGLWALPAAASVMSAMAGDGIGRTVIYAVTPMGMCVAAEGMAFLARRIVVHLDGRDIEAEAQAAAVVRALAYHRARAVNHPDASVRKDSEREAWKLARDIGAGDYALGAQLLQIQRERVTSGADAALGSMFAALDSPVRLAVPSGSAPALAGESEQPKPPRKRGGKGRKAKPPARTPEQLLADARDVTVAWPDEQLTAERIRTAVGCSQANARTLREALRDERRNGGPAPLHVVGGGR